MFTLTENNTALLHQGGIVPCTESLQNGCNFAA